MSRRQDRKKAKRLEVAIGIMMKAAQYAGRVGDWKFVSIMAEAAGVVIAEVDRLQNNPVPPPVPPRRAR